MLLLMTKIILLTENGLGGKNVYETKQNVAIISALIVMHV